MKRNQQESRTQIACVEWFGYQYPTLMPLLFAVPNGGKRSLIEAKIMKGEGVKAGVSDLLFLYPNKDFHFLAIEMKTPEGKQSPNQKRWQKDIERLGFGKYVICRSVPDFMAAVNGYIKNQNNVKKTK